MSCVILLLLFYFCQTNFVSKMLEIPKVCLCGRNVLTLLFFTLLAYIWFVLKKKKKCNGFKMFNSSLCSFFNLITCFYHYKCQVRIIDSVLSRFIWPPSLFPLWRHRMIHLLHVNRFFSGMILMDLQARTKFNMHLELYDIVQHCRMFWVWL